jgi:NAD(P)-dependent dehydrogenase (short-subunit alcohol dehydrogenase family)
LRTIRTLRRLVTLDGRMGTPDEVAAGIAFIASGDGRFIDGS